jgi:hypothetical protein
VTGDPGVTLEWLAFNWGDAYLIHHARDQWAALRRDTRRFLTAQTLDELAASIETDYAASPVPRDRDPPGTADYLDAPDQDQDGDQDGNGGRLGLLAGLREAFPQGAISYAPFSRAWTARKDGATICQSTPALLCFALTLIERKQRRTRHGPGRDGPPGDNAPPS